MNIFNSKKRKFAKVCNNIIELITKTIDDTSFDFIKDVISSSENYKRFFWLNDDFFIGCNLEYFSENSKFFARITEDIPDYKLELFMGRGDIKNNELKWNAIALSHFDNELTSAWSFNNLDKMINHVLASIKKALNKYLDDPDLLLAARKEVNRHKNVNQVSTLNKNTNQYDFADDKEDLELRKKYLNF